MSLEDQIAKLTAAVEKQNALTERLLSNVPAAAPAAETKVEAKAEPKAAAPAQDTKVSEAKAPETKKEETPADPYAISTADLLVKITNWVKEFARGTPEGDARHAALAETLKKIGETKVSLITDATKLSKLNKWFETKMKGQMLAPTETAAPADEDL